MRIDRRNANDERKIVTAMIVDSVVLGSIADKWNGELFNSKWSNLIASWCVKYYQEYNKAPGKSIQDLFERWASRAKDEKTVSLVETFLESLSNQYKTLRQESNSQLILDTASRHFNKVRALNLKNEIEAGIENGELDKVLAKIDTFGKVEIGGTAGIDILRDTAAIKLAFHEKSESLIDWPEPMDRFFGDAFCRGGFISFEGPEKRGKSFALLDVAWRAMLSRRRVAFFEVGDMTQAQTMRRFLVRAARNPIKAQTVRIPKRFEDKIPFFEDEVFDKPLSWQAAKRACDKVIKRSLRTNDTLLRLSCHSNSSISVRGIESILAAWDRQGWMPDMVVIDYADILQSPTGIPDGRDAINATWKQLRALSQRLNCCVVTATQAKATAYSANTMGMEHFSEDKRKRAHITGMIGLNQNDDDRVNGIMRLNWIALREGYYSNDKCLYCAQCLPLSQPFVRAVF
jgi:hypothetical protein